MSIAPTFSFSLGQAVLPGPIAVGKCSFSHVSFTRSDLLLLGNQVNLFFSNPYAVDGANMSLACAASGGRVVVHTSAGRDVTMTRGVAASAGQPGLRLLNINRDVKCLASSNMRPGMGREVLLIGTTGSTQAYDIHENSDLFYKDSSEPVTALACGTWPYATADSAAMQPLTEKNGGTALPIVFSGGNCSVSGCSGDGSDAYWTVAGDIVTALCVADVDGDGKPELLVGSADAEIRVLQGETVTAEITEADRIVCLAEIPLRSGTTARSSARGGAFAYALANGAVGVYGCGSAVAATPDAGTVGTLGAGAGSSSSAATKPTLVFSRLWRVKLKSRAVAVAAFDFDGDGVPEVVAGWATGRLEIRKAGTGELLFREQFTTSIAGLAVADYRSDSSPVLLVVTTDGQVRAYPQVDPHILAAYRTEAGLDGGKGSALVRPPPLATVRAATKPAEPVDDDVTLAALLQEKRSLEALIREREIAAATAASNNGGAGDIPATAHFRVELGFNHPARRVELVLTSSTPDAVLRAAVATAADAPIFSEGREAAAAVPPYAPTTRGALGVGSPTVIDTHTLRIPLPLRVGANPVAAELIITAVLAAKASAAYGAALSRPFCLPMFPAFQLLPGGTVPLSLPGSGGGVWDPQALAAAASLALPAGCVSFFLKERAARVSAWLSTAFCTNPFPALAAMSTPHLPSATAMPPPSLSTGVPAGASPQQGLALDVRFVVLRAPGVGTSGGAQQPPLTMLRIAVASEHGGPCVVQCEDMGLAGEIVTSFASWAGITELATIAEFPAEMEAFKAVLARVADGHAVRTKLTGEMAETSSTVKALLVEAEDSRGLSEMPAMRASYARLRGVTGDLLREYAKRAGAHSALMEGLRQVNAMIAKAAAVRVGEPRVKVVNACRAALKANNGPAMLTAIGAGKVQQEYQVHL